LFGHEFQACWNMRSMQLPRLALFIVALQGATGFSPCARSCPRALTVPSTACRPAHGFTLICAIQNGDTDETQHKAKDVAPRIERQPASQVFLPWIDGLFDGGVAEFLIVLFTVGILSPFLFLAVADPLKVPSTDIVRQRSGNAPDTDIEWVEQEPSSRTK